MGGIFENLAHLEGYTRLSGVGYTPVNGVQLTLTRKPSCMLIIDHAQGTGYINTCADLRMHIKHWHIPITIALLAQSWMGIPRVIHLNTTQFAVYKAENETQLKQIYDTFTSFIEYE